MLISVFVPQTFNLRSDCSSENPTFPCSPLVLGTHAGCLKTIIYPEEQITAITEHILLCKGSGGVLNTTADSVGLQCTKGLKRRDVKCMYSKRKKLKKVFLKVC